MIVPLFSILLFVVSWLPVSGHGATRRATKRLMLLASIAILPPALRAGCYS
jgi:hypothetical protein